MTSTPFRSAYLKRSIARRKAGVNILFHGPPGTGKTQLARVVGQAIGMPVFEFATEDSDGDPIRAMARLNVLRVTSSLFANTPTLFVFDEAEDIFSPVSITDRSSAQAHKGWFNRLLENNKLPILWISNSISTLDPAYLTQINEMLTQIESFPGILIASTNLIDQLDPASLRRFDIKIHFGYLLPAQASRLLISHCQNLGLPQPTLEDLTLTATMETATPGDFAAVARELVHKSIHPRRIGFQ